MPGKEADYSRKDDWKIITNVRMELNKRWVNCNSIKINCTRGVVDIEGMLEFTGQGRNAMDSVTTVANMLKKFDTALRGLPMVRDIKWKLAGWERTGRFWRYSPTPYIRKISEKKGIATK
jgi:hypothetical protein